MSENNQALIAKVSSLVEKYDSIIRNRETAKYVEAMTKTVLIQPLFEALGWKFDGNEVTLEENVGKDFADYGFRINGVPKFFLEAKSLKVDLDHPKFIKQAIDYAWYKGCPWAVLTNFERIRIFNAEWKGKSLMDSHFMTIGCHEFIERLDDLLLLSKEGFSKGLLDKKAEGVSKKAKKVKIDKQLLSEFTGIRENLLKNIQKQNHLEKPILEESVQRILDRLIFIRSCEDRGIEENPLLQKVRYYRENWEKIGSKKFIDIPNEMFRKFDERYNSALFREHDCEKLKIDSDVLIDSIELLYESKDKIYRYDFAKIDADILGNMYEQYLSYILKGGNTRVHLEDGRLSKKAQGIYYTPTYIVDYIVSHTVTEKCENLSLDEILNLKIVDPACGSGSFLIRAFSELCEIVEERLKRGERSTDWVGFKSYENRLNLNQKRQIMLNCIHGVDLDEKAAEIAQLNLLLKILEGETMETLSKVKDLKKLLPLLTENIRIGNSLIDDESVAGDKKFDWREKFDKVFSTKNGFDIVIGNPPYVRQETLGDQKEYLINNYETSAGTADLYVYFIEKAMSILNGNGTMSYIVANKWMRANYGKALRSWMKGKRIEEIIDFGDLPVFENATTYPCIIRISKGKPKEAFRACEVKTLFFESLDGYVKENSHQMNQDQIGESIFTISTDDSKFLIDKILSNGILFSEYTQSKIFRGVVTGFNEAFTISDNTKKDLIKKDSKSKELIKPFAIGKDLKKYRKIDSVKYLIFTRRGTDIENYPAIKNQLLEYKERLMPKPDNWKGDKWQGRKPGKYEWYEIQDSVEYHLEFEKPKICWGNLCKEPPFTFDENKFYINAPACILPSDDKYLLGLLNSKVLWYFLRKIAAERQGGFIEAKPIYVKQLPIHKIDKSKTSEVKMYDEIVSLVEKMLTLNKRLSEIGDSKTDERYRIEEEIKKTDAKIDEIIYKLYGITDEERKVIEGS